MYNLSDLRISSDKQLQDKLIFNDWNFMSLRSSLVKNKDFVLINKELWNQLQAWFKGGPSIRIFIINDNPDLNPIRVKINNKGEEIGLLISTKITNLQFKNYITEFMNFKLNEIDIMIDQKKLLDCNKSLENYNIHEGSIVTIIENKTHEEYKELSLSLTEEEMLNKAIEESLKLMSKNSSLKTERHRPPPIQIRDEEIKEENGRPKTPSTGESTPTWKHKNVGTIVQLNNYQYLTTIVKQ